jgi:hypothetical protein
MSWDTAGGNGGEWNDGAAAEPVVDSFADGTGENDNGGDAEGGEGGGFSGECYNCGQTGLVFFLKCSSNYANTLVSHSKQSCPEPPKPRPCFNCGEGNQPLSLFHLLNFAVLGLPKSFPSSRPLLFTGNIILIRS